jgi:hypothetical protein
MSIYIEDHSLVVVLRYAAYILRPCKSWDGRFSRGGKELPWFKHVVVPRDGGYRWDYFSVPYILFGRCTKRREVA